MTPPWTQPIELSGKSIRLRPLQLNDAFALQPLIDVEFFKFFVTIIPDSNDLNEVRGYVDQLLKEPNCQPFVIERRSTGDIVGVTCYMDMREPHRSLEIGMTWLIPDVRGSRVNPEMKLLMLEHAFENLLAVRVQLKTDGRNQHSQRAIAKLGAKPEGTLRKHGITKSGFVRDTVMFSITDEEWPEVKASLIERLRSL